MGLQPRIMQINEPAVDAAAVASGCTGVVAIDAGERAGVRAVLQLRSPVAGGATPPAPGSPSRAVARRWDIWRATAAALDDGRPAAQPIRRRGPGADPFRTHLRQLHGDQHRRRRPDVPARRHPDHRRELLSSYVELGQPATRQQIIQLADATVCPPDKKALEALADDVEAYTTEVLDRRISVLDLLERFPACQLAFASFLQLVGPLTPRQHSISSSPQWSADHVTLTIAVLRAPALSETGVYEGTASTYLAQARPGTKVAVTVRPSNVAFHPPASLDTPIVMICAGSGLAPFHGFIQDRALRAQTESVKPAPALLFFGCDAPDVDYLYRDELEAWARKAWSTSGPPFPLPPSTG
jgi:hypothetical protein